MPDRQENDRVLRTLECFFDWNDEILKFHFMRKIFGFIVYVIVQILFIPFGIIGAIIIYYKQMYVSKKFGVSSTAIEIINGRWINLG